jgi:hypothetical protein
VHIASPGRYGDGSKLYLLVHSAESAWWLFRYAAGGELREIGLGPARGTQAVSLASARERAAELYRTVGYTSSWPTEEPLRSLSRTRPASTLRHLTT